MAMTFTMNSDLDACVVEGSVGGGGMNNLMFSNSGFLDVILPKSILRID
jgi:hypothetical protein